MLDSKHPPAQEATLSRPSTQSSLFYLSSILLLLLAMPLAGHAQTECGILVSIQGTDSGDCGGSRTDPCRTINHGIARAQQDGYSCVLLQAGTYAEIVTLAEGIDLIGGFDANWEPGSYSMLGHRVEIVGGLDGGTGQFMTVRADAIAQTGISNLVLVGPTATGEISGNGLSSYTVFAKDSELLLQDLRIEAGDAAAGAQGMDGADATQIRAASGGKGGNAIGYYTVCDATSAGAGGLGGVNPSGVSTSGGSGGHGGHMDTCCTLGTCSLCNCDATPGLSGASGGQSGGGYGSGGGGGSPCGYPGNGGNGYVMNGSAGNGGS